NKQIRKADLYYRGLINKSRAHSKRTKVCNKLKIPVSNGKTFLKIINMLDISLERIDKILNERP
ncbi:MAG: DUF4093 domain-containing protein, partial [Bacillota bacterium]